MNFIFECNEKPLKSLILSCDSVCILKRIWLAASWEMDCRGARVEARRPIRDDCPPGTGTMDGSLDCSGGSEEGDKGTDKGSMCSLFKIMRNTCLAYRRSLTNGSC